MNPLIIAFLAAGSVAGVYTATVELYRASHAQLVTAAGYLPSYYLARKRVGEPLPLPAELPQEPAQ